MKPDKDDDDGGESGGGEGGSSAAATAAATEGKEQENAENGDETKDGGDDEDGTEKKKGKAGEADNDDDDGDKDGGDEEKGGGNDRDGGVEGAKTGEDDDDDEDKGSDANGDASSRGGGIGRGTPSSKKAGGARKKQNKHQQSTTSGAVGTQHSNASSAGGGGGASSSTTTTTATPGGIDAHPYPRGSVIEVVHVPRRVDDDGSEGRSDDDDRDGSFSDGDDDSFRSDSENEEGEGGTEKGTSSGGNTSTKAEVRLCDIIDRVASATTPGGWRYYVHYRDFNRRMDEWIYGDRIVSPPSVGNAKVRALKKKKDEEERKRKRQEEEEAMARLLEEGGRVRKRLRRAASTAASAAVAAVAATDATTDSGAGSTAGGAGGGGGGGEEKRLSRSSSRVRDGADAVAAADDEERRLTRRQRRKSRGDGMDASGASSEGGTAASPAPGGVAGGGAGAAAEERISVDVVATVPAQELDEHEGLDEASLREHEEVTKVKNVAQIELGRYRMDTWYFSPIPKELLKGGMVEVLYIDEFTLNFFTRKRELLRFQAKTLPLGRRHPPGNEIYRNGNLSMFEVDGKTQQFYCQNLCYIAKLFLDHKTLYYDVDPFLFYVLCEVDDRGFHPVGYFSKEKYSDAGFNLACILTFPCHQRKGYGRFLIAFSYELSKKEEKVGSPEKPMSDLGQQAYKPYWNSTIVDFLLNSDSNSMSIMDISKQTSIMAEDIIFTLNQLGILKFINGVYFIAAERSMLEQLATKHPVKEPRVDPTKLHWTPFITDVKRDKFSIHSKKPSVDNQEARGAGGF